MGQNQIVGHSPRHVRLTTHHAHYAHYAHKRKLANCELRLNIKLTNEARTKLTKLYTKLTKLTKLRHLAHLAHQAHTLSPHLREVPRTSGRAGLVCAGLLRRKNIFYSILYTTKLANGHHILLD